ncbi:pseudouridine synthase [Legionella dresdenensis]|uniref:Pseudouridine synthase n=1 Tax=Legionella dresdenensis TaxID=450200 RepID=A0ABV8CHK3_9GAMM
MPQILLFNKPYDVLCQFTGEKNDTTLANFIQLPDFYPAGRLDKNSEGLLILTNDGRLQHQLSHPRYNKKKHYWVQVEGVPKQQDLEPIRQGLLLNGIRYLPAAVKLITEPEKLWPRDPPVRFRKTVPTSWLEIILQEGKNHQVRKMTAAIGFPTLRLIRHRIADWQLNDLLPGQFVLVNV